MAHILDKFKYCPVCGSSHFEINNVKSKKCQDCGFSYYLNASSATVALMFFKVKVKDLSHVEAMDDAAAYYWIPLSEIHIEDFAFDSIRKGLKRFLATENKSA